MNKAEAVRLVQQTFTGDYAPAFFEQFITNIFKGQYIPLDKRRDGNDVREAFRSFVQGYRIIGTYKDAEGTALEILEVTLQRNSSLDRARTAQRNFVSDYLKRQGRDAALVAFLSPDQSDWRFSLVKLEYALEVKDGKVKTEEELTPAKRWSFLIGRHEGSHTVRSRFLGLLQDGEKPLLKELEDAFNIESVTDEFFKKYCELFFRMKESLDKLIVQNAAIRDDFAARELTSVDFAKKTLGQMAFLYFLQKKGWFGVAPGKPWGTGPKDFLRQLFNKRQKYGQNFFDDVLEPLFYEALAQDRGIEQIYPRLNNCRMPFLNGGLFEPMNGYSWETTEIRLPDELFSNSNRTPEGDEGDGILDVFDRYNFTVNENEPLEKEVAVDPEMLGKVFENLLEVKDRKSKGTFYTPREIVHYMCQESLVNFLTSEMESRVSRGDIDVLIRRGSQIIQNDALVLEKGREGTYKFLLPESVRLYAEELDAHLAKIKVCDPAVGSGAFPLGMLNEIVQARQALGVHLRTSNSTFDLKLHSISNSLYGVDIDPGAVEIAKLRLWLALVVEENEPHPLPNLEHKIMQGNSLISQYEGVKLFDDNFLEDASSLEAQKIAIDTKLGELQRKYISLHTRNMLTDVLRLDIEREVKQLMARKKSLGSTNELLGIELTIFDKPGRYDEEKRKTGVLKGKIAQFVTESSRSKKQLLKTEIEGLKWELIEASMRDQGRVEKLSEIKRLRTRNIRPFFVWKLEFADVFQDNGGFDVVIANPPYVGEKGNKEMFQEIAKGNLGKFYLGKVDLFYFFFHLAIELGSKNAQYAFITTNYFVTAGGARKLRADLKERATIRSIINFNELKIFETALGQHNMITLFSNGRSNDAKAILCTTKRRGNANVDTLRDIVNMVDGETDYISVSQSDLYDGVENYIRLSGVGASESPLDSVLSKIASSEWLLGDICNVNIGMRTGSDKLSQSYIEQYGIDLPKNSGIYVLDSNEVEELGLNPEERKIVVPFFKNSDVWRYGSKQKNDLWLIDVSYPTMKSLDESRMPNIARHLRKFRPVLEGRRSNDNGLLSVIKAGYWWAFTMRQLDFSLPKIVAPQRSKRNDFGYNSISWRASMDVYYITRGSEADVELKYVLALLNSKAYFQWLYHRGKRKGDSLELYQKPLSEVPIPKITLQEQAPFVALVDEILLITMDDKFNPRKPSAQQVKLEEKIDEMVCGLLNLTSVERAFVEAAW